MCKYMLYNMKGVLTCITGCCMGKGGIKKVLIYQYVLVKRPLWDWDMGVLLKILYWYGCANVCYVT